jgi:dipeptide/tripeptide permease
MSGIESTIRFLLLPSQIFIVLLLEFLNSFRSFGLRFILYNYITNEYGISDTQAGVLLGMKGFVDIGFGLAGSILVDIVGVRCISLIALSVALIGRSLLAFGRTKAALYPALFVFSPCGDALLSTGLYAVALKKLTTPLTRPLAFAISYATFNLAGAFADIIFDNMSAHVSDYDGLWGVYTPMRQ